MINHLFRKTIFISLLSHITVFSIFGFSFGRVMPAAGSGRVNFWGQILNVSQVVKPEVAPKAALLKKDKFFLPAHLPDAPNQQSGGELKAVSGYFFKPFSPAVFGREKAPFAYKAPPPPIPRERAEGGIIFHPVLPYHFTLFFRDRQLAHVELSFRLVPHTAQNTFEIKRKISSGNLEVDLLSMRYIWHYLFVRQADLTAADHWQTVKIDLSRED